MDVLRRHFALLLEANRTTNLTRITDPVEAATKLYLASLAVFPALSESGVVPEGLFDYLDLGTGAGFPGIPVAVAAPHLAATLVDSRGKKADFVRESAAALGLDRVRALWARGGEIVRREPALAAAFDLVTARAVAPAAEILGEVKALVRPGGYVAIYKGPGLTGEETAGGEAAARRYGFVFLGVAEPEVEELSPRIMVYSRWSAGDEGVASL